MQISLIINLINRRNYLRFVNIPHISYESPFAAKRCGLQRTKITQRIKKRHRQLADGVVTD